jgi:hypothetical protein
MGGDLHNVREEWRGVCGMCGHATKLFELPGRPENLCLACSADLATAMLLRTEIDAATWAGQSAEDLVAEFGELSRQTLTRAQSADALESY